MEAIVLAGGFGTRLQKVVNDLPKSMALINDKPFLEYLLNFLTGQGIQKVILSVGYKREMIREHFKDHFKHLAISYAIEEEPLGTGGGILNAMEQVEGDSVFAMNGDSMFRIDLPAMKHLHESSAADLTMALRYLEDTSRFGTVQIDEEKRVTGFFEKDPDSEPGYINGGIYLINKKFLDSDVFGKKFSIEKDCFETCYKDSRIVGYPAKGYFLDIGIPEDYMTAQDDFKKFDD
ncbi:MAG: nucleotidyltransferase family protein [Bacteroidetes bacterium]|nr:nucleotidyltransferase family protein [Bacteroidota bacterium]